MKTTGYIAALVACVTCMLSFQAGLFDRVRLERTTAGPFDQIYREYGGPYQGLRYVMTDVSRYLEDSLGMEADRGFGVYFHDSAATPGKLTGIAGCLARDPGRPLGGPYRFRRMEAADALVGTFPLRTFMSYMSGFWKFYPALRRYLEKNGCAAAGPVMEVYDLRQRTIMYVAPIAGCPPR